MKKSIPKLEMISKSLYSHQTHFKFTKSDDLQLTDKYRKGRINAAMWLNELVFYYIEKEKNFINEFNEHIQNQKKELGNIEDGDFKQGIFDELNIIEEMLKEDTKLN